MNMKSKILNTNTRLQTNSEVNYTSVTVLNKDIAKQPYTLNKYRKPTGFLPAQECKNPLEGRLGHTNIAMVSSSRTSSRAPMSAHVTSGIVTKPSLLAEGCTDDSATIKSFISMHSFCSCSSGKGACSFSKSKSLCNSSLTYMKRERKRLCNWVKLPEPF